MAKNGDYTKQSRHIARIVHFVRNGEKWKMKNIDWCEGDLQLEDIATKNIFENDLYPIIKYVMVRIDNWDKNIVQAGWQNIGLSMEYEFCKTWLDWVEDSIQSVWNVFIKFDTRKEHWKLSVLEGKQCCSEWKRVLREHHVYREIKSLELTV